MAVLDIMNLRNELCNFLRYSDILTTAVRGVTRVTGETWTVGVGGEATHTLANTSVRDIKSLTVDATEKYYLRDYTLNFSTGVITWNSALSQDNVVLVTYDHGSSDKIFPDMPRDDLTLTSYPRIGIELTSISTVPLGLGGSNHISDLLVTIPVWLPVNKDTNIAGGLGGLTDLEATVKSIRSAIRTNAKLFYSFPWIYPKSVSPITKGTNGKIMQQSSDFFIRFLVE